jgi:hypothetical protein
MDRTGWLVQIYEVSDEVVQTAIFGLLVGIESLTVQATRSGRDAFLIIESSHDDEAWSVHRFVTSSDPGAKLLHTSSQAMDHARLRGPEIAGLWS